jgi:sterol desaturase/sphingolipid hydroxylase (fatty acid hydroxylase superfamily)
VRLETSSYYALGAPLFAALMALEAWLGRRRGVRVYRLADDLGSLACGMGQLLVGVFIGPLVLWLYAYGYSLRVVTLPANGVVTWVIAFVGVDLCYYFYHRAGHRMALLWSVHGVHHQSEDLNFAVALRQPFFSDLYAPFFYFSLALLGVPEHAFFAAIAVLSVNQVTLHTRLFPRASFGVFNTPQLHELHHAKNAPYVGKNFGATLIIWDKLFGTYAEPDPLVAPELGTTEGYATHDGVASQWIGASAVIERVRDAKSMRGLISALFGAPAVAIAAPRARVSDSIPRAVRLRVVAQFAVTTAIALACLWCRAFFAQWQLAIAVVLLLASYRSCGRLLDGARPVSVDSPPVRNVRSSVA